MSNPASQTLRDEEAGAPPSYDSLYGRMKQAKETSSGSLNFMTIACALLFGTIGCTILLALTLAIPVTMICIGAVYKDKCEAQPYIPIFLIVGGSFGLIKNLISLGSRKKDEDGQPVDETKERALNVLHVIDCFLFAWFIAGCVWVYGLKDPSEAECHPTVYLFSFWFLNVCFIMCALSILGACCMLAVGYSVRDT